MASAFIPSLVDSRGRNPYESQSGYGSPIADWQRDTVISPMVRARGAGGFAPLLPPGPTSSWSPVHAPTINVNLGQPEQPNDFETIKNVKNSSLQTAIDSVLNDSQNTDKDFSKNPYVLRDNVKDQAMQDRISAAGGRFDADVSDNRKSLADFTKTYLGADPQAKAFTDQETGAIGSIYGGAHDPNSMQFHLDQLAKQRALAMNRNASLAMQQAIGTSKMNSLMGVNDSSVDQRLIDATGRIAANTAATNADQSRADYMSVIGAQTSNAGRRGALLDDYLKRGLVPADMRMRMGANELGQLGQIGAMTNANHVYTMDSPDMAMQRRLGILGGVSDLDARNNFYGLRKPYGEDTAGYFFPNQGGPGPGYQPSYNTGGFTNFGTPGDSLRPPAGPGRAPARGAGFFPRPGMNHGTGTGYAGPSFDMSEDGGYADLSGNFDFGNPNLRNYAPDLYQQGWDPAEIARQQQYYS